MSQHHTYSHKKLKKENAGFLFEFGNCVFFVGGIFVGRGFFSGVFVKFFHVGFLSVSLNFAIKNLISP